MAAKKKAKSKAKPKSKKAPAKKKAAKAKRPRAAAKKARKTAKPAQAKPAEPKPPGKPVGVVTHYFGEPSVAIIKLKSGTLRLGDTIHIRGHTTDFEQKVESLQVDHAPVSEVGPKDDFGMKVSGHVREHDVVYKVQK
ncbi:MAG TPA: EF-Tu/IF-2/RF-3 family GTPase [Xanthobacteraceae bacterium]|nr:EF-Tu/IF-2/RF-3 family GTPase [Xanthobacteraceae bacterium]